MIIEDGYKSYVSLSLENTEWYNNGIHTSDEDITKELENILKEEGNLILRIKEEEDIISTVSIDTENELNNVLKLN